MAKIEYKVKGASITEAPNGRLPYIKIDDKIFGDSSLIIDELKKRFGDPLDSDLSEEQKTQGTLLQRVVEDHLYFAAATLRWNEPHSLKYVREYFVKLLPPVIRVPIFKLIRRDFNRVMRAQGMGEHSRETIVQFVYTDVKALASALGSKNFFLGEKPSSIDATLYGFLIQGMWVPWENPVKEAISSHKNLVHFCEQMKKLYWS